MIWQEQFWNYRQFGTIVGRLRDYLGEMHLQSDDVVPVMVGNRLEMLAAHYAVPSIGAILNSIITRLDPSNVNWILKHAASKLLLCDLTSAANANQATESVSIPFEVFSEIISFNLNILN